MSEFSLFVKEFIEAFPSTFWTAVGGFLIWLLTTLSNKMSNAHARKMQRDQFRFQAEERLRERQYEVKREVILPALEAGNQAVALLAELCRADIDPIKVNEGIANAGIKMGAASAMGSMDTWTKIGKFQMAISKVQSELALMRAPIELENSKLKYSREQASVANRELEAANADQRRAHGENGYREEDVARITRIFEASSLYFESMNQRQSEAAQRLHDAMLLSFQRFREELPALAELALQCIVALRTELEIPSDEAAMLALQAELLAQNDKLLGDAADQVRSLREASPGTP
ncbi:hypothetical protein LP085_08705 [Achromobacter sp. MY14]|uniref:hypothetical protein n=1 Tax=unclassified Achromobacter TaxID=2626865 RepID=UPI001E3FBD55|nr:hypothetical protein [Achromobacter sp. MY14]MCD0496923.1 hypothetical protein [Achromobacter sp. MY14]